MNLFSLDGCVTPQPAPRTAVVHDLGAGRFTTADGEAAFAVCHGNTLYVQWRGRAWRVERHDPTISHAALAIDHEGQCHAPMPGVVVSCLVQPGQAVALGEALLVIESMKLQATIVAPHPGHVTELPLAVGQSFQRGALLAMVAALESR